MDNYITINRRIFEHPFWCEDRAYSRFEAWVDILQSARFEDTRQLIGNRLVEIQRGQFPVSLRYLASRWKWSTKKVNSFLDCLILDKMILKETPKETGQTVITICNYDKYNYVSDNRKQQKKQERNTEETPRKQSGNKYNKENIENKEKITTSVVTKDTPSGVACCASDNPVSVSKTWKEDFNVYLQDVDTAYTTLVNDGAFLAERQRFHSGLDIRLSLEKAYKDYWSTEEGWRRKKSARSKSLDWKRTFVNALTLGSNKVYLSAGIKTYVPVTDSQKTFTAYLEEHAPLMLNMPVQPTDEEIDELRKIGNKEFLSIIEDINNNRYLTNGRNSVYQTIIQTIEKRKDQK